jgi:8-oxo-dGTP diphosphatase
MLYVTCALIINDRELLITQNNGESDHPFQWEFPGGKIKKDESPEECILREIKEELHIEITILKKMASIHYDYGFRKVALIPFLCSIKNGTIKLLEHNDCKWVKLSALGGYNLSMADQKLIQQNKNQEILKEYVWE